MPTESYGNFGLGCSCRRLLLSAALLRHGVATTLLVGGATPAGVALAARYGFLADVFRVSDLVPPRSLQWTPEPGLRLGPRVGPPDPGDAHMGGGPAGAGPAGPPPGAAVARGAHQ